MKVESEDANPLSDELLVGTERLTDTRATVTSFSKTHTYITLNIRLNLCAFGIVFIFTQLIFHTIQCFQAFFS